MGQTEIDNWIWVWEHLNSFYFDFVQKNVQFEMKMVFSLNFWIFFFFFCFPPALQIGILILIHFEQKYWLGKVRPSYPNTY